MAIARHRRFPARDGRLCRANPWNASRKTARTCPRLRYASTKKYYPKSGNMSASFVHLLSSSSTLTAVQPRYISLTCDYSRSAGLWKKKNECVLLHAQYLLAAAVLMAVFCTNDRLTGETSKRPTGLWPAKSYIPAAPPPRSRS